MVERGIAVFHAHLLVLIGPLIPVLVSHLCECLCVRVHICVVWVVLRRKPKQEYIWHYLTINSDQKIIFLSCNLLALVFQRWHVYVSKGVGNWK